jgi:hypothetical protein
VFEFNYTSHRLLIWACRQEEYKFASLKRSMREVFLLLWKICLMRNKWGYSCIKDAMNGCKLQIFNKKEFIIDHNESLFYTCFERLYAGEMDFLCIRDTFSTKGIKFKINDIYIKSSIKIKVSCKIQ